MAFTTLTALRSDIVAMSISDVKTKQEFRPRIVSAENLPLLYTRLPIRRRTTSTLGYVQGLKVGTIEIVIITNMLQLKTPVVNDALATTLTDALGDALEANAAQLGMDNYVIEPDEDTIGDGATAVQVIVATVEVSG